MQFQKATKKQARLRLSLIGPSGSGKTYSALAIATNIGKRIALIDTERGSASKYADLFEFDVLELESFHPQVYINAIRAAEEASYDVLIIDSLSHAWTGKDGALELVDREAAKSKSGNSFAAWRNVTPLHNALIDAMIGARLHLIATMRSKVEYIQSQDDRGRTVIKKVGMQPVQRDGMEYEFDVVADMDLDNNMIVSKSRCPNLTGTIIPKPGANVAETLNAWLSAGEAVAEQPRKPQAAKVEQSAVTQQQPEPTPDKPKQNGKPANVLQAVVDAGLADNIAHAAKMLNLLGLAGKPEDEVLAAAKAYRDLRNAGKEPEEAAEMVGAGYS